MGRGGAAAAAAAAAGAAFLLSAAVVVADDVFFLSVGASAHRWRGKQRRVSANWQGRRRSIAERRGDEAVMEVACEVLEVARWVTLEPPRACSGYISACLVTLRVAVSTRASLTPEPAVTWTHLGWAGPTRDPPPAPQTRGAAMATASGATGGEQRRPSGRRTAHGARGLGGLRAGCGGRAGWWAWLSQPLGWWAWLRERYAGTPDVLLAGLAAAEGARAVSCTRRAVP